MNHHSLIVLSLAWICITLLLLYEAEAGETDDNPVEIVGKYIETDIPNDEDASTFKVFLQKPDGTVVQMLNLPDEEELPGLESGVSELSVVGILSDDEIEIDVLEAILLEADKGDDDDDEKFTGSSSDDAAGGRKYTGDRKVLVVRVKADDARTSVSQSELSDSVFGTSGDPVTAASQFAACSHGKLTLSPAIHPGTSKNDAIGSTVVTIPGSVDGKKMDSVRNLVTRALNEKFNVTNPAELADHVMYCLPYGVVNGARGKSWGAYADFHTPISLYNNEKCTYSSFQMHELLHNLNIRHANERDYLGNIQTYWDKTGVMGYGYLESDTRMCTNAYNSYVLGWYQDRTVTFDHDSPPTTVKLVGIADYEPADNEDLPNDFYTLIRFENGGAYIDDFYINFNRATGINQDTQEGIDQVTVVSAYDSPPSSSLLEAKLLEGERFRRIKVGCIDTNETPGVACVCINYSGMRSCKDDCSCSAPKIRREYIDRNVQIQARGAWSNLCWSLNANATALDNSEISLQKCNEEDEYQRFHLEDYATGKNGRPSLEDMQTGPLAMEDITFYVIRPKVDPSLVLSVHRAKVKAWLRVKKTKDSDLSFDSNIFFDLDGGEVVLGDASCKYFGQCLFAVSQGFNEPTVGTPVILRDGQSLYRESVNRIGAPLLNVYATGTPRGEIIAFWKPFGN